MLSKALRLIRVYHDLSQGELAKRLKVSKAFLSEIENGKKNSTIELIEKYSIEFNIPSSSILFFSENLENPSKINNTKNLIDEKILLFLTFLSK